MSADRTAPSARPISVQTCLTDKDTHAPQVDATLAIRSAARRSLSVLVQDRIYRPLVLGGVWLWPRPLPPLRTVREELGLR